MLVGAASVGRALTVDSSQEVQLDGVLGHPVLELVEELTAAGQAEVPLIQLDGREISRSSSSSSDRGPASFWTVAPPPPGQLTTKCSTWLGHIHFPAGRAVRGGSRQSMWKRRGQ